MDRANNRGLLLTFFHSYLSRLSNITVKLIIVAIFISRYIRDTNYKKDGLKPALPANLIQSYTENVCAYNAQFKTYILTLPKLCLRHV